MAVLCNFIHYKSRNVSPKYSLIKKISLSGKKIAQKKILTSSSNGKFIHMPLGMNGNEFVGTLWELDFVPLQRHHTLWGEELYCKRFYLQDFRLATFKLE